MNERTPPLSGLRILDLTHDWAGPHATRLLADFGAQVIRVENPHRLDLMRGARKESKAYDHHPAWHQLNRNKLSVTLDLKRACDAEVFRDLVRQADVVVESSRAGVMDRLGLGYESLITLKPDLIMVSMSAFGATGPEAGYAGYGGSIEALAGIQSLTAYQKTGPFRRIRELDVINGILGAAAVLTALAHRNRTGEGQWVDLAQLEGGIHGLIGEHLLAYAATGVPIDDPANFDADYSPQGCYRCAGADEWVVISVRSEAEWARFCDAVSMLELRDDPRFATNALRVQRRELLDSLIASWTSRRRHSEVMTLLQSRGIVAGAVLRVDDIGRDRHLKARDYLIEGSDGSGPYPRPPIRFSVAPAAPIRRGPLLGEHNQAVLCGILDRMPETIPVLDESEIGTAFDVD